MTRQLVVLLLGGGAAVLGAFAGSFGNAVWKWLKMVAQTRSLKGQGIKAKPSGEPARAVHVTITYDDGKTVEIEGRDLSALTQAVETSLETADPPPLSLDRG